MSQKSIEIYVRSSPLGSDGIHWRNISKDGQPVEEPEVLKSRIVTKDNGKKATINSLISDTKPSIVLAQYDGRILLEVTGLEASKERSLQLGRRITEVVLWVGDDSEEVELQLRNLAAGAILSIRDEDSAFLKLIRDAIQFDNLNGFRVDQDAIAQLSAPPEACAELSPLSPLEQDNFTVWKSPRAIVSNEDLQFLAQQIRQNFLPKTEQPVVVIAEIKISKNQDECLEYRGNIWKEPVQDKVSTNHTLSPMINPEETTSSDYPERNSAYFTNGLIVTGVVIALLMIGIMISFSPKPQPATKAAPKMTPVSPSQETTIFNSPLPSSPNLKPLLEMVPNLTPTLLPKEMTTPNVPAGLEEDQGHLALV